MAISNQIGYKGFGSWRWGPFNLLPTPDVGVTESFGFGKYANQSFRPEVTGDSDSQAPTNLYDRPAGPQIPAYNQIPDMKVDTGPRIDGSGLDPAELARQKAAREDRIRSGIKAKGSEARSFLDNLSNQLSGMQRQDEAWGNQMFDQVLGGLQAARDTGIQKLGYARDDVGQRTRTAINDLQQNLRNLMRATSMQLGAMGAGDSSASEIMAPYAFSKVGSNARAGVMNNANSQYNDINMKEQDIVNTYAQEKSRIETDKISWLSNIAQDYRNKFLRIQEAKNNVNAEERDALNNLEESLLNDVANKLRAVESYVLQRNAELDQWANSRINSGWQSAQGINDASNYQVKNIEAGPLAGLSQGPELRSQREWGLNPMLLLRKRLNENLA